MKIRLHTKPAPEIGATRIRSGFLFFPRIIGDEFRWLRDASWLEVYRPSGDASAGWFAMDWIG